MKKQNNKLIKGIFLALLTSIISGIAIFYSKISITKINPLILTTARNAYVGILFFMMFFISFRFGEIKKLKKKELIYLTLIGIIGGALPFYLFFTGLQFVQAPVANLIHKTLFIWVSFLAVVFLKEKLNTTFILSYLLVIIGIFYFADLKLSLGNGEMMVFAATLLWSVENILAKKVLKNISSELVGLFRMGIGSILLFLTVFLTGKGQLLASLNLNQLPIIFIGGTILFFYVFTWYKALKYAPANLVTLILVFSVVVGNILNGSFAGVKILPKEILSSLLISIAIIFIIVMPNLFRHLSRDPETSSG